MRDHRGDVEPRLQQDGHLVPGFVHLPAIDSFDGQHIEYDVAPVDRHIFRRDPEHGDSAAVSHVVQHVSKC